MRFLNNNDWVIVDGRLYQYLGKQKEMIIPNGVKSVDSASFRRSIRKRNRYKKVVIPKTLKFIPESLFDCKTINELVIEKGVEGIGTKSFSESHIEKVTIPSTVKYIDYAAFYNCNLTEVILNEGIQELAKQSFGGNPLSEFIFPKSLSTVNLDALNPTPIFISNKAMDIVCYFNQIDQIKCEEELVCNLSVIVDDDFNSQKVYTFLENIKKKKHNATIRKVTFMGYNNKLDLVILEMKALILGIEIEIEMVEEIDENLKNKISKSKDEFLEQKEVFIHSGDQEIDDLVNEITEKSEILEENLKKSTLSKVDSLLKQYQKDLEELRPKLNLETGTSINSTSVQTPQSLRIRLISDLQKINTNFISLDNQFYVKEKIEEYREIAEDDSMIENPEQVESIEEKIQAVKYYDSLMNQDYIHNKVLKVLEEAENELLISSPNTYTLVFNENIGISEQELNRRINDLYQRVKEAYLFDQSLRGENNTSLANDMKELDKILNFLDNENKKNYQEQLDSIKNKYIRAIRNLIIDSNSELDVRKELVPVLENLSKLIPNVEGKKGILEDISASKKLITEKIEEIEEELGAITSTTGDMLSLLERTNLNEQSKQQIKNSLLHILDDSYQQIMSGSFIIEEREDSVTKNLDWSSRATLQILSEFHQIENFIDETIKYNEEIESFNTSHGKGA